MCFNPFIARFCRFEVSSGVSGGHTMSSGQNAQCALAHQSSHSFTASATAAAAVASRPLLDSVLHRRRHRSVRHHHLCLCLFQRARPQICMHVCACTMARTPMGRVAMLFGCTGHVGRSGSRDRRHVDGTLCCACTGQNEVDLGAEGTKARRTTGHV